MVSKITKKTPTKSIKNRRTHHTRHRKRSPIKSVVTSINQSIYACHRRLIKIFTKLTRLSTPPRKKGYQLLTKSPDHLCKSLFTQKTLPPSNFPTKRTIFLDLDETLVHSKSDPPPPNYDFIVRPVIDDQRVNFYVLKRPFVDELLEKLSKKYEIVIFTAGIEEYASLVLDRLDWKGLISHRFYRDSCKQVDGKFVKDLSGLGRELKNVVIVDDNPNCYLFQPDNAVPITPFTDDVGDVELKRLVEFFEGCEGFEDMRDAVKHYLAKGDTKVEV